MIRLKKRAIPTTLVEIIAERTTRFAMYIISGEPVPKSLEGAYKDVEVKNLLKLETSNKCAYCESKMLHVDYGDVEHIVPKGSNPVLRYQYDNLTLACGVCNTNKAEHLDILNPYSIDPEHHLMACGPTVFRLAHSDVGLSTEKRLQLNRPQLIEKRQEKLDALQTLADQIARTKTPAIKDLLLAQLNEEARPDKEYSLVAKAFTKFLGMDVPVPLQANT